MVLPQKLQIRRRDTLISRKVKMKRAYRGTEDVCDALGVRRQKFGSWVTEQRKDLKKLCADFNVPDHIKEAATKRLAELLPVVKCDDGKRRYVLTGEQLDKLEKAMHPPMEHLRYRDWDGVVQELLVHRDEVPQPRDPVTGKMTSWTEEMLHDPDRFLPQGWDNLLGLPSD